MRRNMSGSEFATWCKEQFPSESGLHAAVESGHVTAEKLFLAVPPTNDASIAGILKFLEEEPLNMGVLNSRGLINRVRQAGSAEQWPKRKAIYFCR